MCTMAAPNEKDAMTSPCLDRKVVSCATWRVHNGTGLAGEILSDFFCRLAGRSAPTGLAMVHWIGCINAIK